MLKMAIFGSGSGTNCQAIIDAVEAGILDAKIKWISSKASTELFLRDCGKSLKTLG